MFCPQCGASNPENAAMCVQCGRNFQPVTSATPLGATGVVIPPGATVPNYLVFAILATVLCCLPTGIAAIIYAAQVNTKLQAGDYGGANESSKNAKMWCWISVGIGLAMTVGTFGLAMLGMLGSLYHH
jgi:interferon-induced transmembrane protein